jgi:hypothetical protein
VSKKHIRLPEPPIGVRPGYGCLVVPVMRKEVADPDAGIYHPLRSSRMSVEESVGSVARSNAVAAIRVSVSPIKPGP